jgi:murein DD-endopeptidase MepM/ murein hydrolase activator NlpD
MQCSSLAVSVGQTVQQGQVIAYVGSTGVSTGAHLHFGVIINGTKYNPLQYVSY